ncbi:hypothetical protein GDO78_022342 [Eleutherodactylus coqui]|uniref:Uncharacterized protein n=1 Tax=Eleutherodactylus coqui TaxID=57060 RepID=A0A8J6BCF0_ELECQ|nr:hypothetical protein GDO78_022342 [Eleutherodactylus coqui]
MRLTGSLIPRIFHETTINFLTWYMLAYSLSIPYTPQTDGPQDCTLFDLPGLTNLTRESITILKPCISQIIYRPEKTVTDHRASPPYIEKLQPSLKRTSHNSLQLFAAPVSFPGIVFL